MCSVLSSVRASARPASLPSPLAGEGVRERGREGSRLSPSPLALPREGGGGVSSLARAWACGLGIVFRRDRLPVAQIATWKQRDRRAAQRTRRTLAAVRFRRR